MRLQVHFRKLPTKSVQTKTTDHGRENRRRIFFIAANRETLRQYPFSSEAFNLSNADDQNRQTTVPMFLSFDCGTLSQNAAR